MLKAFGGGAFVNLPRDGCDELTERETPWYFLIFALAIVVRVASGTGGCRREKIRGVNKQRLCHMTFSSRVYGNGATNGSQGKNSL